MLQMGLEPTEEDGMVVDILKTATDAISNNKFCSENPWWTRWLNSFSAYSTMEVGRIGRGQAHRGSPQECFVPQPSQVLAVGDRHFS